MLLIILLTISAVSCLPVRESLCHRDDEFACKNGSCISAEWICDNVADCLTGEDEINCHYLHECSKDSFMCRSGECLSKEVKCDGHQNCSDGSDERGCKQMKLAVRSLPMPPPSLSLCHPDDEFACKNGSCISAEWVCDNVADCLDGEDESDCHYLHECSKDSFMCHSGECLPKEVKCDGHLNCPDGSDERGCKGVAPLVLSSPTPPISASLPLPLPSPSTTSSPLPLLSSCHPDDEFACKNGSCISAEWICDNVPDCLSGEDEINCHYLHECSKDLFMCHSGECLPKEVKCDGHLNCPDGSDERGCKGIAPLVLSPSTPPPFLSLHHSDDEFACKNGTFISTEWICDNVADCLDGKDEAFCEYLHECSKDSFMCRSGECLSKEVKCDGHLNCLDGSDERGCKGMAPVMNVQNDENTSFWIYLILMVLCLILLGLIGFGLKYWFCSPPPRPADDTKVQFLVVEDDGRCTAY